MQFYDLSICHVNVLKKSLKQFEQSIKSCVIRYTGYLSKFMFEKVVVGLQTLDYLDWITFNRLPVSSEGVGVTSAKLKHRMHLVYFLLLHLPLHQAFLLIDSHSHHFQSYGCWSSNNQQNKRRTLLMLIHHIK